MKHEIFRSAFLRYFHNGQLRKTDRLLAWASPVYLLKKNARTISRNFRILKPEPDRTISREIKIKSYEGSNPIAKKITAYLEDKIPGSLKGAYVHGSVGTGEEVAYSDFDGLVIIKNECILDPGSLASAAKALKETEKMMLEMDPLQHHGWFILGEFELKEYPEQYFPSELFSYSKCLFGEKILKISTSNMEYGREFNLSFQRLSKSVLDKLESKAFLQNYYEFKNLLSQFMLLPAIYLQAQTGKGVFKKISFEIMEKELGAHNDVMKEISEIRRAWDYQPTPIYLNKLRGLKLLSPPASVKKYSGSISGLMRKKFDAAMIGRMKVFVTELRNRLNP